MTTSGFLYSVDIVLDDSTSPVVLGIRDGQTAAQAALGFCHEQGLDEDAQTVLIPQLIKVLEEGLAEALGPKALDSDDALPLLAEDHADPDSERGRPEDVALDDPVLTLGVSLGGEDERMLNYYAGQDPLEVAMAFCTENLVSSTPADQMTRCFDALSAHLAETISGADSVAAEGSRSEQRQQQEGEKEEQQRETQVQVEASSVREPLITVPLNINGRETVLQIFRESHAVELASELCRREEFGLEESSMNSCLSQITEIAHRAILAYDGRAVKEQRPQAGTDPFTFKVPVTLAGLQLHAEFKTSETPRASARRFCTPNLRKIESALGLELHEGENKDTDASQAGGVMSESRESLREACTVIVEDAINAVLLGLRERVMEAEMLQANTTDPSYDENSRWSQEEGVQAEAWAASQRRLLLSTISVAAAGLFPRSAAFLHAPTATAWKRSSSLHASTTTGTRSMPAAAAPADASDDRPVEPAGTHHPWYSLAPLKEAGRWAKRDGEYFNELSRANGGASVFKGHPGLAVTFLTDNVSCEWFFSQPPSVLDRQDGAYFGALKCKKDYIGEALPTLITNEKESHQTFRKHALKAFGSRVPYAQSAIDNATNTFYKNLWKNGMNEYTHVYDFFLQQLSHFTHEWMFGLGEEGSPPIPPFKDFINSQPFNVSVLIELEIDTPVANLAAKFAQMQTKTSAEALASVENILSAIRSSKVWAGFLEMLEGTDVSTKDLERSFMFTSNFQSSVPIAITMMPVVATLTANPEFLEDLRKEIDGKDLTFDSVKGAENFPLLDSFHWEIQRMYAAPAFTVKRAKKDLVVPTTSGTKYKIKKGEYISCEQVLCQMDPAVFGSDAREFNPRRFVDNPELKKKVFLYGYIDHADTEDKQWGCVAHAIGMLDGILKIIYGKWVQEAEWELTKPPVIDVDVFAGEVGPEDMSFAKVTPRKKQ
eukprot:g10658.t1